MCISAPVWLMGCLRPWRVRQMPARQHHRKASFTRSMGYDNASVAQLQANNCDGSSRKLPVVTDSNRCLWKYFHKQRQESFATVSFRVSQLCDFWCRSGAVRGDPLRARSCHWLKQEADIHCRCQKIRSGALAMQEHHDGDDGDMRQHQRRHSVTLSS